MATIADFVKAANKKYGDTTMTKGSAKLQDCERIPTSIFPLDLALGGGFPMGAISEVYGPESSGKTNIALKAIATHQKMFPDLKCIFVDVEHAFDGPWAVKMGVNVERLEVISPDNADQIVDMVEGLMGVDDCGLIVVDSIAAMASVSELKKDAGTMQVGGNSIVVGQLIKKAMIAQSAAAKNDNYPTLICINQIRFKIGVMFGDPETTPGGNALRFYAKLRVRCYGKNEIIKEVSATMPAFKKTSVVVKKWKVPIVAVNCEYLMAMIPHSGLHIGELEDWNTISNFAKNYGLIAKIKGGWSLDGKVYPTLTDMKDAVRNNFDLGIALKSEVINLASQDANGTPLEFHEAGEPTSPE